MKLDQAKAIEALIRTLPGALNIKNGKQPPKLMPGQEASESDLMTVKYMIPIATEGNGATVIAVRFIYDKRQNMGLIEMSDNHIILLSGKEMMTARKLYEVLREDDKRIKANITCYKCGHVIEHECW
ncbi:MAG: hypothetical protein M0R06_05330 [Sphaerochaeta sp.]|jgi:hypothetical protein|nr:hypothetical protein [Sphaerochaeta sp.]